MRSVLAAVHWVQRDTETNNPAREIVGPCASRPAAIVDKATVCRGDQLSFAFMKIIFRYLTSLFICETVEKAQRTENNIDAYPASNER